MKVCCSGLFGSLSYSVNEKVKLNTFASYSLIFSSSFRTINYGGFVTYDMHLIGEWILELSVVVISGCATDKQYL